MLAVCAPGSRSGNNINTGLVQVFHHSTLEALEAWIQVRSTLCGQDSYNMLELALAISADGNVLIIFVPTIYSAEQVCMYHLDNSIQKWIPMGNVIQGKNIDASLGGTVWLENSKSVALLENSLITALGAPKSIGSYIQCYKWDDFSRN